MPMRVLMLANMRSGVGRAPRLARAIERQLTGWSHEVITLDVGQLARSPKGSTGPLASGVAGADAVVSIGGDGTIHHALPDLLASRRPVYHVPGGNENLFAREFGMSADPIALARALETFRIDSVDVGAAGGRPFAIMVSVGPDAGVIHRLHASRGRASGHAMYLGPVLHECLRPHLPCLSVRLDGRPVVAARRGLVVIANSRQYAARLDPAPRADMRDGLLDVVFLPAQSTMSAVWWGLRCGLGEHMDDHHAVYERGSEVVIESSGRAPWQADGEVGGWIEPGEPLALEVRPATLRVLRP